MKKMFYKKIKILLLLLISFVVFQQIVFCDQSSQEGILIANLGAAKNKKQEKCTFTLKINATLT